MSQDTKSSSETQTKSPMALRFRGFLPVIVDVETGGFNANSDALLEIAAVTTRMTPEGKIERDKEIVFNVDPFDGANVEQSALDFTGIDLDDDNRESVPENIAMSETFQVIRRAIKDNGCNRAILVGHNAHFDLNFVNAASYRCELKRNPFHPFSCFDTATLSGLAFGHTVLARTCQIAGIEFDNKSAHSAIYDAQKTADLFCMIINKWEALGGWPLEATPELEPE